MSYSRGGCNSFGALSRSSCVSRRQARKLATSLATSRTRPSVIFIWIPNDFRCQPPDSFPANHPFSSLSVRPYLQRDKVGSVSRTPDIERYFMRCQGGV